MSRCLGLDLGEKRIGVAISDPTGILASPLPAVARTGWKREITQIRALVRDYEVETIVVGMPVRMDGTSGAQAERAGAYIQKLQDALSLAVLGWDERLTTREAERRMLEADVRRNRRREVIDGLAACLILQGYLDRQRAGTDPP